jgi:hypothetical protein
MVWPPHPSLSSTTTPWPHHHLLLSPLIPLHAAPNPSALFLLPRAAITGNFSSLSSSSRNGDATENHVEGFHGAIATDHCTTN